MSVLNSSRISAAPRRRRPASRARGPAGSGLFVRRLAADLILEPAGEVIHAHAGHTAEEVAMDGSSSWKPGKSNCSKSAQIAEIAASRGQMRAVGVVQSADLLVRRQEVAGELLQVSSMCAAEIRGGSGIGKGRNLPCSARNAARKLTTTNQQLSTNSPPPACRCGSGWLSCRCRCARDIPQGSDAFTVSRRAVSHDRHDGAAEAAAREARAYAPPADAARSRRGVGSSVLFSKLWRELSCEGREQAAKTPPRRQSGDGRAPRSRARSRR